MQQSALEKRKAKEVRYALQFGAISVFVLLAWVNFRVFPKLVPIEIIGMYSLIAICLICHCSSNAIIFLTLNKELRSAIRVKIFNKMPSIHETWLHSRNRTHPTGGSAATHRSQQGTEEIHQSNNEARKTNDLIVH
uniref:7TM GPCR serpentine receptor class x (Srx) domain-containing protein n=1 Tax=Acrobeloides nanus TaxID=290746 RepID=A0A914DMJ2_9BILA